MPVTESETNTAHASALRKTVSTTVASDRRGNGPAPSNGRGGHRKAGPRRRPRRDGASADAEGLSDGRRGDRASSEDSRPSNTGRSSAGSWSSRSEPAGRALLETSTCPLSSTRMALNSRSLSELMGARMLADVVDGNDDDARHTAVRLGLGRSCGRAEPAAGHGGGDRRSTASAGAWRTAGTAGVRQGRRDRDRRASAFPKPPPPGSAGAAASAKRWPPPNPPKSPPRSTLAAGTASGSRSRRRRCLRRRAEGAYLGVFDGLSQSMFRR